MQIQKNIALVAHDMKKETLLNWVREHQDILHDHALFATGSTATMLERDTELQVTKLESGPLGGDQQIGAMIVDGKIDILIFFWDPLESQPHDPDVRALLRIAVVWNIPVACNQSTADILINADFMGSEYQPETPNYDSYRNRKF